MKLEEDAEMVLKFMASNGLVASPIKTPLLILNHTSPSRVEIKVGNAPPLINKKIHQSYWECTSMKIQIFF